MFFNLKFKRKNPIDKFHSLYLFTKRLTKNKTFEFQIIHYFYYWFSFELNLIFSGQDHAGPELEISLFGYVLRISIHDNRHWNYKKNNWE